MTDHSKLLADLDACPQENQGRQHLVPEHLIQSLRTALSGQGEARLSQEFVDTVLNHGYNCAIKGMSLVEALNTINRKLDTAPPSPQQGTREAVVAVFYCNKCGYHGTQGPAHTTRGQQCNYDAVCYAQPPTPAPQDARPVAQVGYDGRLEWLGIETRPPFGSQLYPAHPPASTPSVPGFVLVPVEPTEEMKDVGDALLYDTIECAHNVYRAMLNAAPQPPPAAGQWMPISEWRESDWKDSDDVLVAWPDGTVEQMHWASVETYPTLTHWMPTPPAPSQQGEANV